jgi:hypothetical protein
MPRYFFHLRGEDLLVEDLEGMDLPNLHAALEEVARANRELASEGAGVGGLAFEVATREGRTLLKVPVEESHRANPVLPH